MANIIKILRSLVVGSRPAGRTYGEPYVNFGDNQFGVIDSSNNPRDLIGVPVFSPSKSYPAGYPVFYNNGLYTAVIANTTPGAFNPAEWAVVPNSVVVDFIISQKAVRYDGAQSLTAPQQTQARNNIGAAAATAGFKVHAGGFFWDISTVGLQNVTGIGFQPKAVLLMGGFNDNYVWSTGWDEGAAGRSAVVADYHGGVPSHWAVSMGLYSIQQIISAGNISQASVVAYLPDGFQLSWTNSGTVGGLMAGMYLAFGV